MTMISKKKVEIFISKLKNFKNPKENLEQYSIDESFWSEILNFYMLRNDVPKTIYDFGAGTGKLSLPFFLFGSKKINFFEIDEDVIPILKKNINFTLSKKDLSLNYNIFNVDIFDFDFSKIENPDLIVMNPPYGTRIKGLDSDFLDLALNFNSDLITMHKTSTKSYINKKLKNRKFISFDVDYKLKQTYSHHSSKIKKIKVTVFIIKKKEKN